MGALDMAALVCALLLGGGQESDPRNRILTYKQYAKIRHGVPYILEFKVGRGALLLYGGRHVFDPSDVQIADIETEWKRFKPTAAYNEGGNPPTEPSVRLAVERYGEPGLVRYLARRDRVPVATFEPSRNDEARALLRRYSAEQVKVFLLLRGFLTFRRAKRALTAEHFMTNALRDPFWKASGLAGPPQDLSELEKSCKRLFGGLANWRQVPDEWFDPTRSDRFTNEAQNDSGMVRDRHLFGVLVERARQGDRVFAVIGASHVPVLESALVAALGNPVRKRDGQREPRP